LATLVPSNDERARGPVAAAAELLTLEREGGLSGPSGRTCDGRCL
jgi:hypothetical protein